ncbi:MAG TPA: rhomboid-like protein [Pseudonocardiaceae bacterium]|nr:rhomboid-like protein [Pseudonocardiaceae bacterium]
MSEDVAAVEAQTRPRLLGPGSLGRSILRALPRPIDTPFTFWYLVVLAFTTMLFDFAKPSVAHRMLALSSTNAMNLQTHPVSVLFLSALWLDGQHWLIYAAIFTLAIAPLERRIGSWRTALVFASGHVLATLATELPVLWLIKAHLLPHNDGHLIDIGVSYGLAATAGALLLLLAAPARWWATAALTAAILAAYIYMGLGDTDSIVTTAGHLTAGAIGMVGWYPWLRKRGLIGSMRLRGFRARALSPALATSA